MSKCHENIQCVQRKKSYILSKGILPENLPCLYPKKSVAVITKLAEGEAGLETKKKPGNPLSRYERRKELTYEEQLQYQIELLKRELVKKEAEVLRLKKLNERKGGDARRN